MKKLLALLLFIISMTVQATSVQTMKMTGGDENFIVDVILDNGVRKLAVQATTVVEEVFGKDVNGSTWWFFGANAQDANGIGAAGDTVRMQIPAGTPPLDLIYPAVDITVTVQLSDIADSRPERAVALRMCEAANADTNFSTSLWKCEVIRDFGGVFISSKLFNEWGERTTYTIDCTGTTVCNKGEADIIRRGRSTELTRSPNDPRVGQTVINGSISLIPTGFSNRFFEFALNGISREMALNGSGTPVDFKIENNKAGFQAFIQSVKCWVTDNGIKFGQYAGVNGSLVNGFLMTVESEGITTVDEPIKTTDDWKHIFSTAQGWELDTQAGRDDLEASKIFAVPFILNPTSISTDHITFTVQDNLSSLITQSCTARGYLREI
ncbi:hypothetical protein KAU11_04780 [Candidatus Babeliales bacterium]|nr:hypothetical protein [Candidatus Babeliales bacterium]